MAARPEIGIADRDPFADLLFSPRAAFIWDRTSCAVTWTNAAGRSKFGLDPGKALAGLPAKTVARLTQGFEAAQANGKASGAVKFKAGRHPAIPCTFEVMELAGGHRGLIVTEAAAQGPENVVRLPAPAKKKTVAKPSGKKPAASKPQPAPRNPAAPACQLTPEELSAFKAIGRTVRRMANEKRRQKSSALPPAQVPAGADTQGNAGLLFSAFDLVLFLDRDLAVARTEGRPQQIGWRKSRLLGKPATDVLPPAEQAIFRRMVKKLDAGAKVCRDTLVLTGEAGGNLPCRAVLGRWLDGNAHYFLALLSLSVPARLKRLPTVPGITRLAA